MELNLYVVKCLVLVHVVPFQRDDVIVGTNVLKCAFQKIERLLETHFKG